MVGLFQLQVSSASSLELVIQYSMHCFCKFPFRLTLLIVWFVSLLCFSNTFDHIQNIIIGKALKHVHSDCFSVGVLDFSHRLVSELQLECVEEFHTYSRMTSELFRRIFAKVEPEISKQDTNCRRAISADKHIAITVT